MEKLVKSKNAKLKEKMKEDKPGIYNFSFYFDEEEEFTKGKNDVYKVYIGNDKQSYRIKLFNNLSLSKLINTFRQFQGKTDTVEYDNVNDSINILLSRPWKNTSITYVEYYIHMCNVILNIRNNLAHLNSSFSNNLHDIIKSDKNEFYKSFKNLLDTYIPHNKCAITEQIKITDDNMKYIQERNIIEDIKQSCNGDDCFKNIVNILNTNYSSCINQVIKFKKLSGSDRDVKIERFFQRYHLDIYTKNTLYNLYFLYYIFIIDNEQNNLQKNDLNKLIDFIAESLDYKLFKKSLMYMLKYIISKNHMNEYITVSLFSSEKLLLSKIFSPIKTIVTDNNIKHILNYDGNINHYRNQIENQNIIENIGGQHKSNILNSYSNSKIIINKTNKIYKVYIKQNTRCIRIKNNYIPLNTLRGKYRIFK